jgi:hypothetical protein
LQGQETKRIFSKSGIRKFLEKTEDARKQCREVIKGVKREGSGRDATKEGRNE